MASKFKLVVRYIFDVLTNKSSEYTGSCKPNKKFSDVAEYVRSDKFFKMLVGGRVSQDSDTGYSWKYDYGNNKVNLSINIQHNGEFINFMKTTLYTEGAEYEYITRIEKMMKALPDYTPTDKEKTEIKEVIEKIDYSTYKYMELLDLWDKKADAFNEQPNANTFAPVSEIKKELDKRIGALPLEKRGAFTNALKEANLCISALTTQLSNPMTANMVSQFVGTYVPQIKNSIAALATLKDNIE